VLKVSLPWILLIALFVVASIGIILVSSFIHNNSVIYEVPTKDVNIKYEKAPNIQPSIRVKDSKIGPVKFIINMYAGLPKAKLSYLGRIAGEGSAKITNRIMKVLNETAKEWIKHLKSIKEFRVGTLLFIDIPVKVNETTYLVYSVIRTVPLNLELIRKGYKPVIDVEVDLSKHKPTRVIRLNKLKIMCSSCLLKNKTKAFNVIDEGCIVLTCSEGACVCLCTKWVSEKIYGSFEDNFIPVMMVRSIYKYWTEPQTIFEAHLMFSYSDKEVSWFKIFIAFKITGQSIVELREWHAYTKFKFFYSKSFYNNRYTSQQPSFRDDMIVAIGFKGSGSVGLYRRYDSICDCYDCSYEPTDITANITVFDINTQWNGEQYEAEYSYMIDDNPIDNSGFLEKYWKLAISHAELSEVKTGMGENRYLYNGDKYKGVDLALDITDIILSLMTGNPTWAEYVPIYGGIGWSYSEQISQVMYTYLNLWSDYDDYYVFFNVYRTKDKVYADDQETYLKFIYIDVDVYPPS